MWLGFCPRNLKILRTAQHDLHFPAGILLPSQLSVLTGIRPWSPLTYTSPVISNVIDHPDSSMGLSNPFCPLPGRPSTQLPALPLHLLDGNRLNNGPQRYTSAVIPGPCDMTLYGKRASADVIKVKDPEMGR